MEPRGAAICNQKLKLKSVFHFFVEKFTVRLWFDPKEFAHNSAMAAIFEILIEIVADEIEKCGKLSIADSSGLVFVPVGEIVQEG